MNTVRDMQLAERIFQYPKTALAVFVASAVVQSGCSLSSRPAAPAGDVTASGVVTNVSRGTAFKTVGVGKASWYGPGFRGRKTASGEIFDDAKLTAAHKSLPLGSKARVINLGNGKTVQVEINDRGPFAEGRIIDLSRAAAHALGMIDGGIADVRVELVSDERGLGSAD
jgi:rare lipoprotein A (peptidoglycan hydrolase)